jgi:hypothetical protein
VAVLTIIITIEVSIVCTYVQVGGAGLGASWGPEVVWGWVPVAVVWLCGTRL